MILSQDSTLGRFFVLFLGFALALAMATPSRADRGDRRRQVVVLKTLPRDAHTLHRADGDHSESQGRFYRRHHSGLALVPPPLGARVVKLPPGHVRVKVGATVYFRFGATYYRPVRGGYRVVAAPVVVTLPAHRHRHQRVVVAGRWLGVHAGPAKRSPILTRIRGGSVLIVTGQRNGWLQVRLAGGGKGWILRRRAAPLKTG